MKEQCYIKLIVFNICYIQIRLLSQKKAGVDIFAFWSTLQENITKELKSDHK